MPTSFARKVAIGIAWMTTARAAVRVLGLISTIVLARLLAPGVSRSPFESGLYGTAWAVLVHGIALALPITYWIVKRSEGAESTLIARVKPILNRLSTGTWRPD